MVDCLEFEPTWIRDKTTKFNFERHLKRILGFYVKAYLRYLLTNRLAYLKLETASPEMPLEQPPRQTPQLKCRGGGGGRTPRVLS